MRPILSPISPQHTIQYFTPISHRPQADFLNSPPRPFNFGVFAEFSLFSRKIQPQMQNIDKRNRSCFTTFVFVINLCVVFVPHLPASAGYRALSHIAVWDAKRTKGS